MIKRIMLFSIIAAITITLLVAVNLESSTKKEEIIKENDQVTKTVYMVYVTPNGKKYHLKTCRTLKNSTIVDEIKLEEAIDRGYEPCKVCEPNKVNNSESNHIIDIDE